MHSTETIPAIQPIRGAEIICAELPAFDESDLAAVRRAFHAAKPCQMIQAWLPEPSPGFGPASVRVGWREDCLLVFAELTDRDIFSNASGINQRVWELGDAFEIFLRPVGESAYVQLDITPNNQRMQLRITSAEAYWHAQTANEFAEFILPRNRFRSTTWLEPENQKWFVYATIPTSTVCGRAGSLAGEHWYFSFGRYDYTRGEFEPVISSTSPHAEANFHRQSEWGVIHFSRARPG